MCTAIKARFTDMSSENNEPNVEDDPGEGCSKTSVQKKTDSRNDSNEGIIYLVQEAKLVHMVNSFDQKNQDTPNIRLKIGMSKSLDFARLKQYEVSSRYLENTLVNDPLTLESIIKTKFNVKFTLAAGKETFEGNETEMRKEFRKIVDSYLFDDKINQDELSSTDGTEYNDESEDNHSDSDDENYELKYQKVCEKICKLFPKYKEDESFGGVNKYILLKKNRENQYAVHYINPRLNDDLKYYYENENEYVFDDYIIISEVISPFVADDLQYFHKLISKKIVLLDKIYDINSNEFNNKITKTKFNIKIENFEQFKQNIASSLEKKCERVYCKILQKIRQVFYCNMIINDELYCTLGKNEETDDINKMFKKLKDFDTFAIDAGLVSYLKIWIIKIKSKYYDKENYLMKYMPYLIRWTTNNDYYILNRNYEYIGLNTKSKYYDKENYLFNYSSYPLTKKSAFIRMCNKYKEIIKNNSLNKCLNPNLNTEHILRLFDK